MKTITREKVIEAFFKYRIHKLRLSSAPQQNSTDKKLEKVVKK